MPQTRMFRDRMVSMEQTLEGGEKHLELLKTLCREALPDFDYVGHQLDHERDLFVMDLRAADGRRKLVSWTRMVLFDAERLPALSGDPRDALRGKIVELIRSRATRPEIVVTFRHLEEGWVDTPEPRRERDRRRRRRGRGGEGRAAAEKGGGGPRERGAPPRERPTKPAPEAPAAPGEAAAGRPGEAARPEARRRFRRRRRRGRGGSRTPPSA